jgi:ketosteroid isomerase-like protein
MSAKNKEIVEKVNASFAENNTEGFLAACADDVKWTMVGEKSVIGIPAIREWMAQMKEAEPPKFTVDKLIAEGDSVVCCGDMTMKDKDGKTEPYGYCDVYSFSGGKIAELTSYVVKTTEADKNLEAKA